MRALIRQFFSIKKWIIIGIIGYFLFSIQEQGGWRTNTKYWFLEPILFLLFTSGYFLNIRRFSIAANSSKVTADITYIMIGLITGILYELAINEKGIKCQIFDKCDVSVFSYLPFVVLGLLAIRKYNLTFEDMYFVGGAMSIPEIIFIIFSSQINISFFLFLPLAIANYFLIYGLYVTLPLLVVHESSLWGYNDGLSSTKKITPFKKFIIGVIIGISGWLIAGVTSVIVTMLVDYF